MDSSHLHKWICIPALQCFGSFFSFFFVKDSQIYMTFHYQNTDIKPVYRTKRHSWCLNSLACGKKKKEMLP